MDCTYRLRIELPDRPGSLAGVTAVIARFGGNVVSIDVHELDGARAVDEIVVDAPDDWSASGLRAALAALPDASLLSFTVDTRPGDVMVAALRWSTALLDAGPDLELELGHALLEVGRATAAWVADVGEARAVEAGKLALDRGGPVVVRCDDASARVGGDVPDRCWLLAVPDATLSPRLVGFAMRPLALRFSASEIARLDALMHLGRAVRDLDERSSHRVEALP